MIEGRAASDPSTIGARVRELREGRGLSLSELARLAGVGKATLSRLEAGGQNPTMETLYALTTALGVPVSATLPPPSVGHAGSRDEVPLVEGDGATAYLLDVVSSGGVTSETYRLTLAAGLDFVAAAHAPGVSEHIVLLDGVARVGAAADSRTLHPGEHHFWAADTAHVYAACNGRPAHAVLVVRHEPVLP